MAPAPQNQPSFGQAGYILDTLGEYMQQALIR